MTRRFFFFNDTATTEIYTLSLHDALPISFGELCERHGTKVFRVIHRIMRNREDAEDAAQDRSEEHTSELQSQSNLVCRLLLQKKKSASAITSSHVHARVACAYSS